MDLTFNGVAPTEIKAVLARFAASPSVAAYTLHIRLPAKFRKSKFKLFSEWTFSPGLCYEPGLKGPPAAAHDPGHVEVL
jgi:hypothetical protein